MRRSYSYDCRWNGANQRYYSSQVGRFLTPDPSGGVDLRDPQSWNRYAYVGNDLVNFADPSGLNRLMCDVYTQFGCAGGRPATNYWGVARNFVWSEGDWNLVGVVANPSAPSSGGDPVDSGSSRGGSALPDGSLTNDFRKSTTNALKDLPEQCKSGLGGVDDLTTGVGDMRFFDGRKKDGDGAYTLSQIAVGNRSQATVYDVVNNRPDSPGLMAVVIPGDPKTAANDAVLISGNFFNLDPTHQASVLVEEAMHAVRNLLDTDLTAIAKKHGYDGFQPWIIAGCGDKK